MPKKGSEKCKTLNFVLDKYQDVTYVSTSIFLTRIGLFTICTLPYILKKKFTLYIKKKVYYKNSFKLLFLKVKKVR